MIDFDDEGFPVGDNHRRFTSYVGKHVSNQVDITFPDWRQIDKLDPELRNTLWTHAMVKNSIHLKITIENKYIKISHYT